MLINSKNYWITSLINLFCALSVKIQKQHWYKIHLFFCNVYLRKTDVIVGLMDTKSDIIRITIFASITTAQVAMFCRDNSLKIKIYTVKGSQND